jgi:hypothetical protein
MNDKGTVFGLDWSPSQVVVLVAQRADVPGQLYQSIQTRTYGLPPLDVCEGWIWADACPLT